MSNVDNCPVVGPLVESQPLDHTHEQPPKSKRKGHARNPSSFLPEYTHSRPTPNSQQRFVYFLTSMTTNYGWINEGCENMFTV